MKLLDAQPSILGVNIDDISVPPCPCLRRLSTAKFAVSFNNLCKRFRLITSSPTSRSHPVARTPWQVMHWTLSITSDKIRISHPAQSSGLQGHLNPLLTPYRSLATLRSSPPLLSTLLGANQWPAPAVRSTVEHVLGALVWPVACDWRFPSCDSLGIADFSYHLGIYGARLSTDIAHSTGGIPEQFPVQ